MTITIGIDPGSLHTGYGIVQGDGNRLRHVAHGVIHIPGRLSFPERLGMIHRGLTSIIQECRPDAMAVEDVFLAKNAKSALKLGQARGAAILAGVNAGLPVYEYSALEIKQAVVGYGRAGKNQIGEMIRYLFSLRGFLDSNAADGLAVAVCHINTSSSLIHRSASTPS